MHKYIDSKMLITIVLASVAVFFLEKWLTKKVHLPDGTVSKYVGNDSLGYV